MMLFRRSGGCWIFWVGVTYFALCMVNISFHEFTEMHFIQIGFNIVLGLPLVIKPLAHWLNMKTIWEIV